MVLVRFIDLFTYSHGGNWNQQWVCHFDLGSGTHLCDIGTLTWLSGSLMLAFRTFFVKMTMYKVSQGNSEYLCQAC